MPFGRIQPLGLVYTIDLSKIAGRTDPRTVEAPIGSDIQEPTVIDWGDGTSEIITSGTWHEHTYAEGAGEVFTVTLRSATGHLPKCYFNKNGQDTTPAVAAITEAIISVDHFAGWLGSNTPSTYGAGVRSCINLKYIDTRVVGLPTWSRLGNLFYGTPIEQNIQSFCFAFSQYIVTVANAFRDCSGVFGATPEDLFDNSTSITDVSNAFRNCSSLTAPYKFWEKSYSSNIAYVGGCYIGCSGMDNSQIPAAYGGTMTV